MRDRYYLGQFGLWLGLKWGDLDGKLVVSTWGPGEAEDAQVSREARGSVCALKAAGQLVDLHGSVIILHFDAVGALSTFTEALGLRPHFRSWPRSSTYVVPRWVADLRFCTPPAQTLFRKGSMVLPAGLQIAWPDLLVRRLLGTWYLPSLIGMGGG